MTDASYSRIRLQWPSLVATVVALWMATGCGGPGNRLVPDAPPEQLDPLRLRTELNEMAHTNMEARRKLAVAMDPRARAEWTDRVERIEYRQSQRLDRIFNLLGNRWPDTDLVGKEASRDALVVAQQIDGYRGVQRRALRLLKEAVRDGRAPRSWVAFLEDRVRLSGGRPQLYGTQVNIADGEVIPRPIAEPEALERRRADMGLAPMDDYLERVRQRLQSVRNPAGSTAGCAPRRTEER